MRVIFIGESYFAKTSSRGHTDMSPAMTFSHRWDPRTRLTSRGTPTYTVQKKFTDAVNGRSGMTFFEAAKSEVGTNTSFPRYLY